MSEDTKTQNNRMLEEVRDGLSRNQKSIPSKYFYNERGSELFERITALPEYYLTRTELTILRDNIGEIAGTVGKKAVVVELGSGSSKKIRMLLRHLEEPVTYIPIDISEQYLLRMVEELKNDYENLSVKPVVADYTQPFELPSLDLSHDNLCVFYPGSTIGNFIPEDAQAFLRQIAKVSGRGSGLLIGVDLKKNRRILEAAYNDSRGITAEFNKNILRRLNRDLGADFNVEEFEHRAAYNENEGRVEMHLLSRKDQIVHLDGKRINIRKGESIHTENSYKYTLGEFERLVEPSYSVEKIWTDEARLFSVQYLKAKV